MTAAERQSRDKPTCALPQSISRAIDQSIAEPGKATSVSACAPQLDARIGNLLFMSERYTEAKPYLKPLRQ